MADERLASVTADGDVATVRVGVDLPATPEEVWAALTRPDRLRSWLAEVDGGLLPGGRFHAVFTSGWDGEGRVEVCEPPDRLQVTTWEEPGAETVLVAGLTPTEGGVRLVIEDRGLPLAEAPDHAAGWQVHVEDLAAVLRGGTRTDWAARWRELRPGYDPDPA